MILKYCPPPLFLPGFPRMAQCACLRLKKKNSNSPPLCDQDRAVLWYLRASLLLSHMAYFKSWKEGVRVVCQKWQFILPKHWEGRLCPCQQSFGVVERLFLWYSQRSFSLNSHSLQTKPAEIKIFYNASILEIEFPKLCLPMSVSKIAVHQYSFLRLRRSNWDEC